ncbi:MULTISPECIES: RND family transporter [unclassified Mycolicibacterium]|uniref:MMPL/RND family transporter n=1 Tax=unclassified Mycolicibacterium TaxID=2636767 RepID=UPI0012DBECF6|nr:MULTISPECIES: MMPL family transporter [unclassified Mycolicibacterium]MUL82150.1 MMPL family transporter [Mycolicibacterium sp. CBMA 329]MUL87916.1 MMPL family transporter [Mycolicibacterium sp. CBMA 331]MUM02247.1 MMPL family transporter [Mycolicibacterium sp. CBMA 334]MUM26468.1 MMPL family transporter [Mycolicibacterium sp. CBMA 295]MUM38213.1 MMPL family transporter [Mycolicibacterium sp. CBMA 247]
MTNPAHEHPKRPFIAHSLRILAVPVILFWLAFSVVVNVIAPQLEVVGEEHSAPMAPEDAPSMIAMKRMGANFQEFDSNSTVMIVVEGERALGPDAHQYYDEIIRKLREDPEHIQHIQDFWGDTLTAAGAQSADGKASYVMLNLAGEQGQTLANEGVQKVREVIKETAAPPGVRAYVAGPAALTDDLHVIGNASLLTITAFTLLAIAIMLLIVYRSIITTLIQLVLTGVGLLASRGLVSVLATHDVYGLTTFAGNILTMLAIAAATDYGIFLFGRYREARSAGEDRETAYYTTFQSVAPVIIGSGLTIAGATYCLSFARLPYFSTMGAPVAIGMLVVIASAITMGPAVLFLGSKVGLYEAKKAAKGRFWYKVGTAVVRWPAPILVASSFVVLIGVVAIPGHKAAYNDRWYLPSDAPANVGFAAADRHFSQARMNPDILMVESSHDMRNPADMLVLDRVAKNVLRTEGIAMVQSITRPLGIPIQHSSIPFQTAIQGQTTNLNLPFQRDQLENQLKMVDATNVSIGIMEQQYQLALQQTKLTQDSAAKSQELLEVTKKMRDNIANFDDQFRPMRNYLYWEPHCFDIPMCAATRSVFDALDGIDELTDKTSSVQVNTDQLADLAPKLTALLPQTIASMKTSRDLSLASYNSQKALIDQMQAMNDTALAMGESFDQAKNDDLFYLPPEAFTNPDFERGLKMFLSPDGKSARMFITHQTDPATVEGIARVNAERTAAQEGLKMSSLSDAKIYLGGVAATYKDMSDGARYDLMIAVVSALTLIFMIMLILTRSAVAALVIVGTAASSIAASFGISVLLWQDLFGIHVHWLVMLMSVIILLAVGSDYNLLLVSRFKEEIHAGLKTGIIRSMGGTGGVVTSAGMVFAATMAAMMGSDLVVLAQMGSTIAIGLLLDTLIVRSLLMPSIATLLGRWFWWPQVVYPRGDNHFRKPAPQRPPHSDDDDTAAIPVTTG